MGLYETIEGAQDNDLLYPTPEEMRHAIVTSIEIGLVNIGGIGDTIADMLNAPMQQGVLIRGKTMADDEVCLVVNPEVSLDLMSATLRLVDAWVGEILKRGDNEPFGMPSDVVKAWGNMRHNLSMQLEVIRMLVKGLQIDGTIGNQKARKQMLDGDAS